MRAERGEGGGRKVAVTSGYPDLRQDSLPPLPLGLQIYESYSLPELASRCSLNQTSPGEATRGECGGDYIPELSISHLAR